VKKQTETAALKMLEAVAYHFLRNSEQMPEAICDAGIALMEAMDADPVVEPPRFNLVKTATIAQLDS
jgi:hypothetical protein